MDEEHQVERGQHTRVPTVGDRLLAILGIDPNKWTVGDRRIALLGIGLGVTIVIVALCGHMFGWEWTGLAKRTFWDWLSLLIVPVVLALGGYLFNRSESRRTQDVTDQQRAVDREIADERRQDDVLQAYLEGISQLLTDKDRPLHRSQPSDSLSTVARARTVTVLTRLHGGRKRSVLQFLYESGLIYRDHVVVDLRGADLADADLQRANLHGAHLSATNLNSANLSGSVLIEADLGSARLNSANLREALLRKVDLAAADLSGADLRGAGAGDAVLWLANLSRADLRESELSGADLRQTNLTGADFGGADLSRADLRGAEGVTGEEIEEQAASLEGTTMPNSQRYEDWLKSRGKDGKNDSPP